MTTINGTAFKNGDLKSLILFVYCAAPDKLQKAFSKYQITIGNNEEAEAIAKLHELGLDRSKFNANFKDIVSSIQLSPDEVQNSSCKVQFMGA